MMGALQALSLQAKERHMRSLASALSDAFDVESGQLRPESAGVEIDRFDGWRLASSADVALVPSSTRVVES